MDKNSKHEQGFNRGNINGLRYPFWGGDRISNCGLPEFNLTSCQDDYPMLHIMNIKFAILEIKQDEQITRGFVLKADSSNRPTMSKAIEMLEGTLNYLQVPPKPFLSSPSRSPTDDYI
ncbi:hypothetical protein FEM48_Zijuj10G0140900 [Ziziphus jujuba var. spinosa]|uniref:Wall-associated receptor kinase galacturonan-binding domain-containing protein n=1 Tax=Ziziphus jujuba var. spinosa TaxID=714518 RepID=A0A978UNU1_ZIZJJ|nr:hypothetical protein FEM48_Zijuj10G0140900 [Ziziphus jujuba var. spinosa]